MNMEEIRHLALRDIKTRRSDAIINAETNRQVAIKNPDYLKIANELGALTIDIAKAKNSGKDTTKLVNKFNQLQIEEIKVLNEMNMTKDDLTPKYTCKLCEDTGVYQNKHCKCFYDLVSKYNNEYNLFGSGIITFNDCSDLPKKMVETAQKLVDSYPNKKKYINVYLTGTIGSGKTTLTQAMASAFISKKLFVIFSTATELNNNFLEFHKSFSEEKNNYLHNFYECDVLVIDDLGTETMLNNVTKEYLLMVISERIAKGKMTIITSNLSNREFIERYGERLFSRLFNKANSITLNFTGADLRMREH